MVVVTIEMETAEDEARLLELLPIIHGRVIKKDDTSGASDDDNLEHKRERLK